jgi:hypothetical protein
MKLLMVDNYDSFTYNLVHLFEELGADVVTVRNDAITAVEASASGTRRSSRRSAARSARRGRSSTARRAS